MSTQRFQFRSKRALLLSLFINSVLILPPALGQQEGTQKWVFDAGAGVVSDPAIGDEGIIYFGAGSTLYAVLPDGTLQWSFDTEATINQPPAIAEDGTIYVGNNDGKIFAFSPDQPLPPSPDSPSPDWIFDSEVGALTGAMAIDSTGTIMAGFGTGPDATIFAVNPDGTQLWSFDQTNGTKGVSIGQDGVVYTGNASGFLLALNPADGTLIWEFDIGPGINAAPSFAEDGTIYVGSASTTNGIAAVNPDGTLKWQITIDTGLPLELRGRVTDSFSTGVNGDVYVPIADSATSGAVVALDPANGDIKWIFPVGARVNTTPLVGFDGIIYFGADTDELYALNPDGTQRWVFPVGGNIESASTIAEDGTLYFGSSDRNFYAVHSSSTGLAASSWPKKQRDVRNTGQFGSDVTRRRWFAPQVYWLSEESKAVVTISHIGGIAGNPNGTTAAFRIDVLNRDGSVLFSIEDSLEPGETKDIVLADPTDPTRVYAGAALIDSPVRDGSFLAPYLTWELDVFPGVLQPLRIGVFFSDPTDAAQVHYFPAEASATNGLGIAVQNIGDDNIDCTLEFINSDGSAQAAEALNLVALGSVVQFFNDSVPDGFKGSAAFSCDAPVVAVAVNQDFSNGNFPTDRVTAKGRQD